MFSFLWEKYLGVELVDYWADLCFTLQEIAKSSKVAATFFTLTMCERSQFSSASAVFSVFRLPDFSHLAGMKYYLIMVLICIF